MDVFRDRKHHESKRNEMLGTMCDIDTNKENNILQVTLERKEDSQRPKNNSTNV
jgi:hypothetical protein